MSPDCILDDKNTEVYFSKPCNIGALRHIKYKNTKIRKGKRAMRYKNFCNIIRVLNIQQEDNNISGVKHKDYSRSREMFSVYTDDGYSWGYSQ